MLLGIHLAGGWSPENMVLQRAPESGSFSQSRSMMLFGRLGRSQETYMFFVEASYDNGL